MDDLYGDILALLPLLREGGHAAGARSLLKAMTEACNKGILHKNAANRAKSRLTLKVNAMA